MHQHALAHTRVKMYTHAQSLIYRVMQIRPFSALSTGQRARAILSRGIESAALFDDFTRCGDLLVKAYVPLCIVWRLCEGCVRDHTYITDPM